MSAGCPTHSWVSNVWETVGQLETTSRGGPGLAVFETRAKHQCGKAVGSTNFNFSTLHSFTLTGPISCYAYARKLLHSHAPVHPPDQASPDHDGHGTRMETGN